MRDGRRRSPASTVVKRSLLIAGHATSISLEQDFWDGLKAIAASRDLSVAALAAEIDGMRGAANLSSAIRVFVLQHYRAQMPSTATTTSPRVQSRHARTSVEHPREITVRGVRDER